MREILAGLPAYSRPAAEQAGIPIRHHLSLNENPDPPPPAVLAAIAAAARAVNRYPEMLAGGLSRAVAARLGVPVDDVVTGAGALALLGQVLQATCEPGDEVVHAWRSFEAYPVMTQVAGARSVRVSLTADARHDLPALAAAVTARTRVILLCTPNNPTGPAIHQGEFDRFIAAVPPGVVVVVDEAYREYATDADRLDGLAASRAWPNVVTLRTFSKAYGLAGLRVGYAVAQPDLADGIRRTALPFGVSGVAHAAALACLDVEPELLARVGASVAERERVRAALVRAGWAVPSCQGNFVWIPASTPDVVERLARCGVEARAFPGAGVRITVGTREANDAVIAALARGAPGGP
jgi:histidinol-phosphate aminotransferase